MVLASTSSVDDEKAGKAGSRKASRRRDFIVHEFAKVFLLQRRVRRNALTGTTGTQRAAQ
jgi:hypothetical protein